MFTGIIETLGKVEQIKSELENVHFMISSPFSDQLKIDQSVAHNGVCLTVTGIKGDAYSVTAIKETLDKTALGELCEGQVVNLERCMQMNGRIDGHIVQGHVDQKGVCKAIQETGGSWKFTFEYDPTLGNITVEKGSVTVNGTSLTVVGAAKGTFSVAIIPYTYEHTNFHQLKIGDSVNLEFDIIGKYVGAYLQQADHL